MDVAVSTNLALQRICALQHARAGEPNPVRKVPDGRLQADGRVAAPRCSPRREPPVRNQAFCEARPRVLLGPAPSPSGLPHRIRRVPSSASFSGSERAGPASRRATGQRLGCATVSTSMPAQAAAAANVQGVGPAAPQPAGLAQMPAAQQTEHQRRDAEQRRDPRRTLEPRIGRQGGRVEHHRPHEQRQEDEVSIQALASAALPWRGGGEAGKG